MNDATAEKVSMKVKEKDPKETHIVLYLANLPTDCMFDATRKRVNCLLVNVQKDVIENCIQRKEQLQVINYGFC